MRPLLLGHRGARASRHIPENTLESFELCLDHGCDGFEFDVRRSLDGAALICHDAIFGGAEIEGTAAEDLALPALEDVLRRFAGRAFLDIELKAVGVEAALIALLRKYPPLRGYVVSSFLPEVLTACHSLEGGIPLGFLCDRRNALARWRELPVEWAIPHVDLVDRELVEGVHAARKRIMVWTVNGVAEIRRLAEWGVDAIISDETERLVDSVR
ncbi:MAG: glycerophosphodiester phosphodiesterase [Terriglobales bacterium]|jgi:glycerophosphoryl diester phosphodiesterase